jgi:hypothetical protein
MKLTRAARLTDGAALAAYLGVRQEGRGFAVGERVWVVATHLDSATSEPDWVPPLER